MTYEEALQIAIEELYDAVEYLKAMNKGFPRVEAQCTELKKAHDLLRKALEDAETDRLRAKKKQIYEDLKSEQTHNTKGEVTYDPETGEPLIDGYPLYSGLPNRKREADLKIGAWLSAALEDPSTCQSMKDDINEWFECTPELHRDAMHP